MLTKSPGYSCPSVNRTSIIRKQSQMESKQILHGNKTHFKNISKPDFKEHGTTEDAMKQREHTAQAQRQSPCFLTVVMFLNSKIKLHKN